MTLAKAIVGVPYKVLAINTRDEELDAFLFTLGCYVGQEVTVVSTISGSLILAILDSRYSIDDNLAKVIEVGEVA